MQLYCEKYYLFDTEDYRKINRLEASQLAELEEICTALFNKLCREFGVTPLPKMYVGFMLNNPEYAGLRSSAFSCTNSSKGLAWNYFNVARLKTSPEDLFEQTAPHEVSHSFCDFFSYEEHQRYPHGNLWQETMEYLGKEPMEFFSHANSHQYEIHQNFEKSLQRRFLGK